MTKRLEKVIHGIKARAYVGVRNGSLAFAERRVLLWLLGKGNERVVNPVCSIDLQRTSLKVVCRVDHPTSIKADI